MPRADPSLVDFHWGQTIRLREGVCLNATIYLPKMRVERVPALVTLTPYISDSHHDTAIYFAERGFPFVVVDVRGRGNSEGLFRPYIQEAADGYDVVEWVATQDFCNGRVAMWGGSYLGYAQWVTASLIPPHLETIVPTAAPYLGADFPMRNNLFHPFAMRWLTLVSGRALQKKMSEDEAFWSGTYRQWHQSGRSFRELDGQVGNPSATFQEWLDHPEPDSYWDMFNPTADQYSRMQLPILTITGSYDDDQPGALRHYAEHMRNADPHTRKRHYLIIGPWDHARASKPAAEFGGLKLGAASVVDLRKLHLEWYSWIMAGGDKPQFLQKQVAFYVIGSELWRYADSLEAVTSHFETYYLDSRSNSNGPFSSGVLGLERGSGEPDTYTFDPRDVQAPEVEAESRADGSSLIDQSLTLALDGKCLVYHSASFEADREISGFFRLVVWISIDCPDTDFYVSTYEIDRCGGTTRLSTDAMRARYREGLRNPKLVGTRDPLCYDFNSFTFVSRQIKRGSRLRVVIAPMGRLLEATFVEKNYNSGGVVADETVSDSKPVTVRLFHDSDHPSALYVPIGRCDD